MRHVPRQIATLSAGLLTLAMGVAGCAFDPEAIGGGGDIVEDEPPSDDIVPEDPAPVTDAWWDEAFGYRVKLQFADLGHGSTMRDVPVLVVLDSTRVDYDAMATGGADLRFVDTDGVTVLDHDVERWDPAGRSFVWIRVPFLAGGTDQDFVYLYYGNPGAESVEDAAGVWSASGHIGVYHLSDSLTSQRDTITNHSGDSYAGDDMGYLGPERQKDGLSAGAIEFTSDNDQVLIDDGDDEFAVRQGEARTMEVWFKAPDRNDKRYIWFKELGCRGWAIYLERDGELRASFGTTRSSSLNCFYNGYEYTYFEPSGDQAYDDDQWHHAALVLDRGVGIGRFYVDGVRRAEVTIRKDRNGVAGTALLGHSFSNNDSFTGLIDEARITDRARPLEWISTQYATMKDELITYQPVEAQGSAL